MIASIAAGDYRGISHSQHSSDPMTIRFTNRPHLLSLLSATVLVASANAQSIPPTSPTQPAPPAAQPTQPAQFVPPDRAAYRARVDFAANQLTITAENSSLNEILRSISHATGMKITGNVPDERVYGSYGPGTTHEVIIQLLDGSRSNVLVHEGPNHVVSELVLSPRTGTVTPPNPNAIHEETDLPPQLGGRRRSRTFDNNRPPETNPQQQGNPPNLPPPNQQQPPPPDPNAQPSPNGVKTPAQIYDDLTKQQQQQSTPQ